MRIGEKRKLLMVSERSQTHAVVPLLLTVRRLEHAVVAVNESKRKTSIE